MDYMNKEGKQSFWLVPITKGPSQSNRQVTNKGVVTATFFHVAYHVRALSIIQQILWLRRKVNVLLAEDPKISAFSMRWIEVLFCDKYVVQYCITFLNYLKVSLVGRCLSLLPGSLEVANGWDPCAACCDACVSLLNSVAARQTNGIPSFPRPPCNPDAGMLPFGHPGSSVQRT